MSIASVLPSNHLILCCPLFLLPSIFPRIRVFSNESTLCMRWPKYWSFSFSISPSNEHPGQISFSFVCRCPQIVSLSFLAFSHLPLSYLISATLAYFITFSSSRVFSLKLSNLKYSSVWSSYASFYLSFVVTSYVTFTGSPYQFLSPLIFFIMLFSVWNDL